MKRNAAHALTALIACISGCAGHADTPQPMKTRTPQVSANALDHEKGGPTEVSVHWQGVRSGMTLRRGESLALEVVDNTGEGRKVRLVTTASGLGGRLVTRGLALAELAANAHEPLRLAVANLPLQSSESASFVSVMAEVERPDGSTARVVTPPLYYLFDADYATATFYDEHAVTTAPEVLHAVTDPMAVRGRVLNPDGTFTEVDSSEDGVQGVTVVGAADPTDFDPDAMRRQFPAHPANAVDGPAIVGEGQGAVVDKAATAHLCTNWRVQYQDAGVGEDMFPTNQWQDVPASFALAAIWKYTSSGAYVGVFWGNLDAFGCVDVPLESGIYLFRQTTNYTRWAGIVMQTVYNDNGFITMHTVDTYFISNGAAGQQVTLKPTFSGDDLQGGAVAGQILVQHGLGLYYGLGGMGIADGTYYLTANVGCGTYDPPTDACYDPDGPSVRLGTTVINGSPESHWKFIAAHEIGHYVQDKGMGSLMLDYKENGTSQRLCRCDHYTTAWANREHCLQSREYINGAQIEGFAQAFAARTFNQTHIAGARFGYYKPFLQTNGTVTYPPVATAPDGTSRWMETYCQGTGTGTELDWMQFYYRLSSETASGYVNFKKLFDIYMRGCHPSTPTEKCWSNQLLNWPMLLSGALAYYGNSSTNPGYVRFRDTGVATGVDN